MDSDATPRQAKEEAFDGLSLAQSLQRAQDALLAQALQHAVQFHESGQLPEAEEFYIAILREKADHLEANHNMGLLALQLNQPAASLPYFERAVASAPEQIKYRLAYAGALIQAGELVDASKVLQFCKLQGCQVRVLFPLIHQLSLAVEAKPAVNGSYSQSKARRTEEKEYATLRNGKATAREQLSVQPLLNDRRLPELEAIALDLAIRCPLDNFSWRILGAVSNASYYYFGGEWGFRRALDFEPMDSVSHYNLAGALILQGRMLEAEAGFRRAHEIDPNNAPAHSCLLFCLSHNTTVSTAELFQKHCEFGKHFESPLRLGWPQHENTKDPDRCLQIGFVSPDLRTHVVAHFIEPIFAQLCEKPELSLHVYYTHPEVDHVTERLRVHIKNWHSVSALSDNALAEKIRSDRIDILIDLSGHTVSNRLLTFARKPAPVQASWIGYPGTTGLTAMDYFLSDQFLIPAAHPLEAQFTERIVRLPTAGVFRPVANAPDVSALPAQAAGYVTFGSFNRTGKITRRTVVLWSRLLTELPTSLLLIGDADVQDGSIERLVLWFEECGIPKVRLKFVERRETQAYLRLYSEVDICLDTVPYSGGTTTFHGLWMGVPTLTEAGETLAGRSGVSILTHVGLADFVSADDSAFVEIGCYWASHIEELAAVRSNLRARCGNSLPGTPDALTTGLTHAFQMMWKRWCDGCPVESLDVRLPANTF
jgi:Tfp pilus assembly protein PilF